ncbi:MAG: sulfur carrier protein ThiS adenylyltransferase ThiF [Desulfobacterales bacterium]
MNGNQQNPNPFLQGIRSYMSPLHLENIRKTRVGIAGAGGLGSNCAVHLVRSGFCRLSIADYDIVEPSNLNRQFFFSDQVGQKKTEKLKENLLRINPEASIRTIDVRLNADNVLPIFEDCPVVIEALDNAEDKVMMVRRIVPSGKFFVSVSGIGGWGDSDRITTRKIKDNFYVVGDMVSEVGNHLPPTSAIVAIAAAKQADLVLSHIAGPAGFMLEKTE